MMTLYSTVGLIIAGIILIIGICLWIYVRKKVRNLDGFVGIAKTGREDGSADNETD